MFYKIFVKRLIFLLLGPIQVSTDSSGKSNKFGIIFFSEDGAYLIGRVGMVGCLVRKSLGGRSKTQS